MAVGHTLKYCSLNSVWANFVLQRAYYVRRRICLMYGVVNGLLGWVPLSYTRVHV